MIPLTRCPSFGSPEIKRVQRNWKAQSSGESYTVTALDFHECPACGERVFDREAMRRIEAKSPAFVKAVRRSA